MPSTSTPARIIRGHTGALALASGFGVAGVVLELARPWPLTIAVDHALQPGQTFAGLSRHGVIAAAALTALAIAGLTAAVDYLVVLRTEGTAERIGAELRQETFDAAIGLSLDFHDEMHSGELVSRVTTDVGRVLDAIVAAASTLIPDTVLLIGIVVVLATIDVGLALVAVAAIPVLA